MPLTFAAAGESRPLYLLRFEDLDDWVEGQPSSVRRWVERHAFTAAAGSVLVLPGAEAEIAGALVGLGNEAAASRQRFVAAQARAALPPGTWRIETRLDPDAMEEAALGWLLAGYRFDRYKVAGGPLPELVAPEGVDPRRIEAIAAGEALTRTLIDTPAADMGPDELERAARDLANDIGASMTVVSGDDLAAGFPLIHAVGRASPRGPRLIEMTCGTEGPRVTLVGKGVCFDTGGLNLKSSGAMALMKKDMGGAAAVLGLTRMIAAMDMPLRLRVLIPAVENSVSGASFRPGDILTSRKGLSVEVNNTDAEGRLVLADALSYAMEEESDLLVSMATLTGAARVALGPDIAPFFTDDNLLAERLMQASGRVRDPLWRLPFHAPYEAMIEPGIADLDNAPKGGFAGAIVAALFLRRFVGEARYVHFDIYGWQPAAAPARPKGGVGQGTRALFDLLPSLGAE